jgi:hypothetical protein
MRRKKEVEGGKRTRKVKGEEEQGRGIGEGWRRRKEEKKEGRK